jgi:hypothetical protein
MTAPPGAEVTGTSLRALALARNPGPHPAPAAVPRLGQSITHPTLTSALRWTHDNTT